MSAWAKVAEMNHEEWLKWRKGGIGSSDAPAIMGHSPWKTAYQTWENKLFGGPEEIGNSSMERGKALEEPARRCFEALLNTSVYALNVENKQTTWLRASLDGISFNGNILVEIKCPNSVDHATALNKKVPEKYWDQCQHQLAVTGLPGMYYFSFDGTKGVIVEVARDDKYISEQLFPKEKQFWDMVLTETPPALVAKDINDMENDLNWIKASAKWKEAKKLLTESESLENQAREALIALSKDRSAKGNNVTLSKIVQKGNVDYKKAIQEYLDNVRAHHPELQLPDIVLDPYRKASFIKWQLRVM